MTAKEDSDVVDYPAIPISPHHKALYEAGKVILADSLNAGREFCKSMIGTSTGAIPIYLGILAFIFPEHYSWELLGGALVILPPLGFLISSIIFVFGYMPSGGAISLDVIEEIENERNRLIRHRRHFVRWGIALFSISTLLAIISIFLFIDLR